MGMDGHYDPDDPTYRPGVDWDIDRERDHYIDKQIRQKREEDDERIEVERKAKAFENEQKELLAELFNTDPHSKSSSLFGSGLTGFIKEKIFDAILFGGFALIILFLCSVTRRSPDQLVQQQKSVHHQHHHH